MPRSGVTGRRSLRHNTDMIQQIRFAHVNLVARDWRRLARFYEDVLGCTRLAPERDYAGPSLDAGTGIQNAHLQGAHLRLPGFPEEQAPTLEIFQYDPEGQAAEQTVNRLGYGHICFQVDDVTAAREEILRGGGSAVGEIVTLCPSRNASVSWCYVRDPEGNIIELQRWYPFGFVPLAPDAPE